jgi:hypothetical protein
MSIENFLSDDIKRFFRDLADAEVKKAEERIPEIPDDGSTFGLPDKRSDGKYRMTVKCPGCGAENFVLPGEVTECEYCGSPLKGC